MLRKRRAPPVDEEPKPRRLPLRWAFIIVVSVAAGIGIGMKAGAGAGIMAGVSAAVGLHTLID
jgi:hypothetical protein